MKSVFTAVAVVFLSVSSVASASKFEGSASGSLEKLRCYSTFEGKQMDYVTITRQERDQNGFVDGLQLKGVWYDRSGKQHFALFDVTFVRGDDNSLFIQAQSAKGNTLELETAVNPSVDESGEATMKINSVQQEFLQFSCDVGRAG
jgi:hypothetical protein